MKQDELNSDLEFTMAIGLEANRQSFEGEMENNHENGKEYVRIT